MGITRAMQPTGEMECVDDAIGNGFTQGMKVMHRRALRGILGPLYVTGGISYDRAKCI